MVWVYSKYYWISKNLTSLNISQFFSTDLYSWCLTQSAYSFSQNFYSSRLWMKKKTIFHSYKIMLKNFKTTINLSYIPITLSRRIKISKKKKMELYNLTFESRLWRFANSLNRMVLLEWRGAERGGEKNWKKFTVLPEIIKRSQENYIRIMCT